jgi:gamma-glutamylcyclotransferase (GGCT)/AIG2-like uncharacterized protein YtfP
MTPFRRGGERSEARAMADHLFVYGTLLPGLAPVAAAPLVARLRPLGPATVPGRLYDLGPYPALVFDPSAPARVCGELFALPDDPALLAALDSYEECVASDPAGGLYRRVEAVATLADGRALACWVYAYNRDVGSAPLIAHGDYRRWVGRKEPPGETPGVV